MCNFTQDSLHVNIKDEDKISGCRQDALCKEWRG